MSETLGWAPHVPFTWVEPIASVRWFEALALSAIASLETRLESDTEAPRRTTLQLPNTFLGAAPDRIES